MNIYIYIHKYIYYFINIYYRDTKTAAPPAHPAAFERTQAPRVPAEYTKRDDTGVCEQISYRFVHRRRYFYIALVYATSAGRSRRRTPYETDTYTRPSIIIYSISFKTGIPYSQ